MIRMDVRQRRPRINDQPRPLALDFNAHPSDLVRTPMDDQIQNTHTLLIRKTALPARNQPQFFPCRKTGFEISRSCGILMASMDSPTFSTQERTGDEVSADRYRLIADKVEADPSLLDIPLANIARWLANGHTAVKRLEGWRSMILDAKASHQGMEKLLFILRDQEWESLMWKGYSPFPGVLTKSERETLSWSSRH